MRCMFGAWPERPACKPGYTPICQAMVATICIAGQVAGDAMHVSPGEQSWTAAAAPLPKPWPTREAAAIAMRWNLARGDDHLLSSQSDPHLRDEDKQVGVHWLCYCGVCVCKAACYLAYTADRGVTVQWPAVTCANVHMCLQVFMSVSLLTMVIIMHDNRGLC